MVTSPNKASKNVTRSNSRNTKSIASKTADYQKDLSNFESIRTNYVLPDDSENAS